MSGIPQGSVLFLTYINDLDDNITRNILKFADDTKCLGLIRRNITYKEKKLITPLYKAIGTPHLEYCIQAWRKYCKKDIDTLEKMQRRATKMIPELRP